MRRIQETSQTPGLKLTHANGEALGIALQQKDAAFSSRMAFKFLDRNFFLGLTSGAVVTGVVMAALKGKPETAFGKPTHKRLEGDTREEICINTVFERAARGDPKSVLDTIDQLCWQSK